MRNLVLDCEVVGDPAIWGWDNYEDLKISVAVVWDINTDEWLIFTAEPHIPGTLPLSELPKLLDGNHIIGHNVLRFDIPLVQTVAGDFTPAMVSDTWHAIYQKLNTMISLQHIVTSTGIGSKTLSSGAEAPKLWAEKRYQEVIDYCKNDVLLEGTLYKKIVEEGVEFPHPRIPELKIKLFFDRGIKAEGFYAGREIP